MSQKHRDVVLKVNLQCQKCKLQSNSVSIMPALLEDPESLQMALTHVREQMNENLDIHDCKS